MTIKKIKFVRHFIEYIFSASENLALKLPKICGFPFWDCLFNWMNFTFQISRFTFFRKWNPRTRFGIEYKVGGLEKRMSRFAAFTTENQNANMSYLALDSNAWQVSFFKIHFRRLMKTNLNFYSHAQNAKGVTIYYTYIWTSFLLFIYTLCKKSMSSHFH